MNRFLILSLCLFMQKGDCRDDVAFESAGDSIFRPRSNLIGVGNDGEFEWRQVIPDEQLTEKNRRFLDVTTLDYYNSSYPQQVHTVFSGSGSNSLIISWVTFEQSLDSSLESVVLYSYDMNVTYEARSKPFIYQIFYPPKRVVHNVEITNLPYNTRIYYQVGNSNGIFNNETFSIIIYDYENNNREMTFAAFGDFGVEYDNSAITVNVYDVLLNYTNENKIDFIVHVGDLAYDMYKQNGTVGDKFLQYIEPLVSQIPYVTGIGCHERDDRWVYGSNVSYGQYVHKFSCLESLANASGSPMVHYYSWNRNNVHFISIDTDPWIYLKNYTNMEDRLVAQYAWLQNDFENIDRTETPWVIVYGHRSLYCHRANRSVCVGESITLRNGVHYEAGGDLYYPLESLFYEYGVDLVLSGHTHHYERSWPVYENETVQENYVNPGASVYVLNGIAGVPSKSIFPKAKYFNKWTAYYDDTYRRMFGHITIHNDTHLTYKAIDSDGDLFDEFQIVQYNHGSFDNGNDDDDSAINLLNLSYINVFVFCLLLCHV